MKYLKFSQYIYIIAGLYFLYDCIATWNADRSHAYLSLFLFALATFMFFFRRHFHKKYDDRNNKQ
ncbi:hypothetical protein [Lacinutrix jangbogonensis]|uniref:hypothetical protein n=1 Tax=Lacinutrix jangbogonensis TaxID=1469557 RepID=UPI00053E1E7F|nr:hypothetical protein [Lacinutrix jangbogonensis]